MNSDLNELDIHRMGRENPICLKMENKKEHSQNQQVSFWVFNFAPMVLREYTTLVNPNNHLQSTTIIFAVEKKTLKRYDITSWVSVSNA